MGFTQNKTYKHDHTHTVTLCPSDTPSCTWPMMRKNSECCKRFEWKFGPKLADCCYLPAGYVQSVHWIWMPSVYWFLRRNLGESTSKLWKPTTFQIHQIENFPAQSTGRMVSSVESPQLYTLISLGIPADTMLLRKWVCQGLALRFHMWLVGMPVNEYHDWMTAKKDMLLLLLLLLMTIVLRGWWRVQVFGVVTDKRLLTWRPKQTLPTNAISWGHCKSNKVSKSLIELNKGWMVSRWASQAQSGQPACCVPWLWQPMAMSMTTYDHVHPATNGFQTFAATASYAMHWKKAGRTSYMYIRKHILDNKWSICHLTQIHT